ncbi:MAG TPA: amino acid ABC transporter permease [Patescibacteria group bacterium]|nr:amino acid ABC transporter permease [Patescibacteria group bacterium]
MDYIGTLMYSMLVGLAATVQIFLLTLVLSIPLGIVVALARLSKIRHINLAAQFYIWIMRGTPLLLQLIFIFFGLPLIGLTFDRLTAAILAFVLNYCAYFGEIFRSGIQSIDNAQYEAAEVLGLTPAKTFLRIVLPQAIKRILSAISNEVITLIKDTSLVYVVGIGELLRAGKIASNRDATLLPLFVVGLFYLILTAMLTKTFKVFEEKFSYYR